MADSRVRGVPAPITTPPSIDELAARLANVQARMQSAGLDCYVSFDPVNIYYLTNFANYVHERPFLLVIPGEGVPTMVAPLLEASHVRGDHILHRTGHGFGITGHEGPYLAVGDDRELEAGMLISIEPGIYIPGQGGFRHSDTVLVTENGCVSLTQAPEQIEELMLLVPPRTG